MDIDSAFIVTGPAFSYKIQPILIIAVKNHDFPFRRIEFKFVCIQPCISATSYETLCISDSLFVNGGKIESFAKIKKIT